jgi:HAD superfamily hydrolase (TIGR01509 family)
LAYEIKNKKAVFWDNDGILVDTEKYYYEAMRQILERENFVFTKDQYIDLILVQAKGPWHLLDPGKYPKERIDELKIERDKLYTDFLLTRDILINGIETIVSEFSKKFRMAIVTSSKPNHFKTIHSRTRLLKYFEFVITSDEFSHYKPHPEPYLKALEKSGLSKEECFVIEDSRRGLLSAKAAGLFCIVIPNELTKTSNFDEADMVLSHISELKNLL